MSYALMNTVDSVVTVVEYTVDGGMVTITTKWSDELTGELFHKTTRSLDKVTARKHYQTHLDEGATRIA